MSREGERVKTDNTLADHVRHPEISYDAYVQATHLALGESVKPLTKVYLDTKYWVQFRKVRLRQDNDADLTALLTLLERLVASGRAVCPLSTEVFHEVFAQSNAATLAATVALIDELSGGICLLEDGQRVRTEALHFLRKVTCDEHAVLPLEILVWTKTAYVLGNEAPTAVAVDSQTNTAIQKAFFDHMWSLTLADYLARMGGSGWPHPIQDISRELNKGKADHVNDYKSFNELFLIELRCILETYQATFSSVMQQIYENDTGNRITPEEQATDDAGVCIANLIYEYARQEKLNGEMPTVRVSASLHAAMRWDEGRKYKSNDCADFRHACAALPYCDYFLTERSLCHLVSDGNLRFDEHFSCQTFSDPATALTALKKLDS
jgi:hypothetical protein